MQAPRTPIRKSRRAFDIPGHVHELTWSCHGRLALLSRDRTCQWLADSINRARALHAFDIFAYVFMPEHVHLLIRPRGSNYRIAEILKSIKQPVARRAVNYLKQESPRFLESLKIVRPSGRTEHRFWQQGGGYDRNIVEPATLAKLIEYIHANPIRRRLVGNPIEWPWSSASWYSGSRDGAIAIDNVNQFLPGMAR